MESYLIDHNISYEIVDSITKAKAAVEEVKGIAIALDSIVSFAEYDHSLDISDLVMVAPIPAFIKVSICEEFLRCDLDGCNKLKYIASLSKHYKNSSFVIVKDRIFVLEPIAVAKMIIGTLLEVATFIDSSGMLPDNVYISDRFDINGESVFGIVIGKEVSIFGLATLTMETINTVITQNDNAPVSYFEPRAKFLTNLVTAGRLVTAIQLRFQLPLETTTLPGVFYGEVPVNLTDELNVLSGTVSLHSSGSSEQLSTNNGVPKGSELNSTLTFYPDGSSITNGLFYSKGYIYTLNTPVEISDSSPGATVVDEQTATNLREASDECEQESSKPINQMTFTVSTVPPPGKREA